MRPTPSRGLPPQLTRDAGWESENRPLPTNIETMTTIAATSCSNVDTDPPIAVVVGTGVAPIRPSARVRVICRKLASSISRELRAEGVLLRSWFPSQGNARACCSRCPVQSTRVFRLTSWLAVACYLAPAKRKDHRDGEDLV